MAGATDRAIAQLRSMIADGRFAPGQRLPPEKELGDVLGVSRNSLREAVTALQVMGILDVRRGDGTFVTALGAEALAEALGFVLDLHQGRSILEIFEIRRLLEPHAAARAAEQIDPPALADLMATLGQVGPGTAVEDLVRHDLAFHHAIAVAGGNALLAGLLDALAGPTVRARVWRGMTQTGAVDRTLAEHGAILDAITMHDGELARSLTVAHIRGVEQWLARSADSAIV
jgi:GntR family transcriptional repressor for pyruvate dehydrogenase complex